MCSPGLQVLTSNLIGKWGEGQKFRILPIPGEKGRPRHGTRLDQGPMENGNPSLLAPAQDAPIHPSSSTEKTFKN